MIEGNTLNLNYSPESVILLIDPSAGPEKRKQLFRWLEGVLPSLNWRSHLFILDKGGSPDLFEEIASIACDFLQRYELATLYIHPVIQMQSSGPEAREGWERILAPVGSFQKEAYREQGEVRLHVLPIIETARKTTAGEILRAAGYFRSRFAKPSFYLRGQMPEGLADSTDAREIRFYLDEGGGPWIHRLVGQLWMNHVLETALERIAGEGSSLLAPCRSHLIADERSESVYPCFARWKEEKPAAFLGGAPPSPDDRRCARCIGESLLLMKKNLLANRRSGEARQVYFKLGLALSGEGEHGLAAQLAHRAFELSEVETDRAAALIHEGLCFLDLMELEKAEKALQLAAEHSADRGLIAYHRGRVQFAWRDYIEALDRFGEALESGSEEVPRRDMYFQMALSHIHLEEYTEARPYIERYLRQAEESAPVSFYRGVCDLGEGKVELALDHFREALRIGPSEEDLGRVLFFIGNCLKEMERYDEAIEELRGAIEADPDDLANHNLLGFCYYKTKRHQQAVECFQRAVEIDPRSGIDWANLGSNLRDLGRIDEAVAMYRKALSLDPTIAFARASLDRLTGSQ